MTRRKIMNKFKERLNVNSIKTKLLVIPLLVTVLGISTIIVSSGIIAKKSLYNQMKEDSENLVNQVISRMEDNARSLEVINEDIEKNIRFATNTMTREYESLSSERLSEIAEDLGIDEINYYNNEGTLIYSNISENIGWKPEQDHPIIGLIKGNETELIEDLRKDGVSGKYFKYGALKNPDGSVVQAGIEADYIDELTKQLSTQNLMEDLGKNEDIVYAAFVDNDLKIEAHSDKERIGVDLSSDKPSITAVRDKKPFLKEDMHLGKLLNYKTVYPAVVNGEHIGALNLGFAMDNVVKTVTASRNVVALTGLFSILVLGAILYFTSNYAIKTINSLRREMNAMALGDFTLTDVDRSVDRRDEFGEISNSVDKMRESVREIIESVMEKSQSLAAHSEEMTATTYNSVKASDEVSKAIEDIAAGSTDQALDTEKGFHTVKDLGSLVEENESHIMDLNESTHKVNELREEGLDIMNELVDKTNSSINSSKSVHNIIEETSKSAIRIETASGMIKDIANQTNLLALNASIEAARAGEAGRGFAVVAEEIRKLAEESNKFTEEIGNIIKDLTDKSAHAVVTMEDVGSTIESQSRSVTLASEKFDGIADALVEMESLIDTVNKSSNLMKKQNDNMTLIMENLAAISEENAASSQEVSAAVEEQTAAITEISSSSEELSNIAGELNALIDKFKI